MTTETAIRISDLEAQIDRLRAALEAARPIVKHAAIDGSDEAFLVLNQISEALED